METFDNKANYWQNPLTVAFLIASVKFFLFIITGNQYGYFRDELYFLACAEHLAFGYPDHAPLSIFIAKIGLTLFGQSLYAIHFFPAVAGAAKIVLTGMIVREL